MKRPLFSIVTPSLNQAEFLEQSLRSVHKQGCGDYEHIVLDGASTDGSQEVLQRFQDEVAGNRLTWRSRPDHGQSAALNEGFGQAQGEIVGWLNADDRYRADCFEHVAGAFAQHPEVDILYGDYTLINGEGRQLALRREIAFSHFVLRYLHVLYIPTTATFFRRRIFDEGNRLCEDLHYAMDLDFFLRLADAGYQFHHHARFLADFRVHEAGKSSRFARRQRDEHRSIVLERTPIARVIPHLFLRKAAARLLQIPAAGLRYSEKLFCGYYFSERNAALFLEQQIRGVEIQ